MSICFIDSSIPGLQHLLRGAFVTCFLVHYSIGSVKDLLIVSFLLLPRWTLRRCLITGFAQCNTGGLYHRLSGVHPECLSGCMEIWKHDISAR